MNQRQRVAVVTGGGAGIGAAVAEELGRDGWFVVTVDPMVTLDGAERLPEPQETTVGRIMAAGGSARASNLSVTDGDGLRRLFAELVEERGGLDAVINVAGISRPTGFGHGSEEDFRAVVTVHLDGYLNVLDAALPLMAEAGHGHVIGVTSGSGWRSADAGAYSRAKRSVAALTWQLGRVAPPGVRINAMSPIAVTRMVTAAMQRARTSSAGGSGGALSLFGSMPAPEEIGPIGAYLAGTRLDWCNGRVVFAGGSEVAVIEEPRFLEVVRTAGAESTRALLQAVIPKAFIPAEAGQVTSGGGNVRFPGVFAATPDVPDTAALSGHDSGPVRSCAVVSDRPWVAEAVTSALSARSIRCHPTGLDSLPEDVDAVVVAVSGPPVVPGGEGWRRVLDEHRGLAEHIIADGRFARMVTDHASSARRPLRLVTLTDATSSGGCSRAQAAAQQARVAAGSTKGGVTAFSVGIETADPAAGPALGDLVAYLLTEPGAAGLAGAELAVGRDWLGLRSHPRPAASVVYGGPGIPDWLDPILREAQ